MKFCLVIHAAPYSSQSAASALRFAQSAYRQGHELEAFFYGDGIHIANSLSTPEQDSVDIQQAWQQLIKQHRLKATICIAAALKRGVLNTEEQQRYEKAANNLAEGFIYAGLGALLEAQQRCDRLINFKD